MQVWRWLVISGVWGFAQKWDTLVVIQTPKGIIKLQVYRQTPLHRANFFRLVSSGFYNGTTFHRVIPGFVVQGGDPNSRDEDPMNDGMGGPGYTIPAEIRPDLKHTYGALGAARLSDAVNPERASSGSQFYIVVAAQGTPFLDGAYTVFGKVLEGMAVAESLAVVPRDSRDRPLQNLSMQAYLERHKISRLRKKYVNYQP